MGSNFFDWDNEDDDETDPASRALNNPEPPSPPPSENPADYPDSGGEDQEESAQEDFGNKKFVPSYEGEPEPSNPQEAEAYARYTADLKKGAPADMKSAKQQEEAKRVGAIASRELAWGLAAKTLDSIPFTSDTLDRVREAARNRTVSETGLAQDLRLIAGDHPEFAGELHNAADKLIRASKEVADAGNVPRNALPLGQDEATRKLEEKNKEIAAKQAEIKTAGLLRAPSLSKELAQLRAEQGALANTVTPGGNPQQQDQHPTPHGDIAAHINATPGGYKNYLTSVDDVVKQLNQAGINVNSQNLLEHVPLSTALAMILKTTDPEDSSGWKKLLSQMQDPSGRGEPGVAFNAKQSMGDDPALMEIKQKQQKYAQVMNQLGNIHASQNWLSAIGMFLTAIVVGPKAAIMIWGRAAQEHSLRTQLQFMHEDIQQSLALRQQQQNLDYKNRALAARQQGAQDMEGRRETAALTRIFVQHQLALERAKQMHGLKDEDAKDISNDFKREMQMAGQALHEGTDQNQFDQAKKDMAMRIYHHHANEASKINDMLRVPDSKVKAFQERKNGVPAGQP